MNILIVEPNRLFYEILEYEFDRVSIYSYHAKTVAYAVKILAEVSIDLIVASYHFEDGDFFDFIPTVRNKFNLKIIPIYLVTSETSNTVIDNAYSSGATSVFMKDDLRGLFLSVQRVMEIKRTKFEGQVLLVEDSLAMSMVAEQYLVELGFDVIHAVKIETALQVFNDKRIDLIILDMVLERGESGSKVISEVRCHRDINKSRTQIVVATGFDSPSRRVDVFNLGADDYIVKPIYKEELTTRISRLFTHKANLEKLDLRRIILEEYAFCDPTSQLYNRYGFKEHSVSTFDLAKRYKVHCQLILIDIDNFKTVNDIHGHLEGDKCIRLTGDLLKTNLRTHDIAGRWGGDEFVVVLYGCEIADAQEWFCRINDIFKEKMAAKNIYNTSFSAGMVEVDLSSDDFSADHLMKYVDTALYDAKKLGRDQLSIFGDPQSQAANNAS